MVVSSCLRVSGDWAARPLANVEAWHEDEADLSMLLGFFMSLHDALATVIVDPVVVVVVVVVVVDDDDDELACCCCCCCCCC